MSKQFLLTGATGFLGSHLLEALLEKNYDLIILKRSFSDTYRIKDFLNHVKSYDIDLVDLGTIFRSNKISSIIHTATNYGRSGNNLLEILKSNLIFPFELLYLVQQNQLEYFINIDTTLPKTVSNYALSKNQFYDWLVVFSEKISCVNVAIEHFYGFQDSDSKFVTKIIRDLLAKIDKIDLTLGEKKRDFIYIDDVINALMTIIKNVPNFDQNLTEFQIGSGKNISIREIVELIQRLCDNQNTQINFGDLAYRQNEIMESKADISKIHSLGWQEKTSLEQGLKKTIDLERGLLR